MWIDILVPGFPEGRHLQPFLDDCFDFVRTGLEVDKYRLWNQDQKTSAYSNAILDAWSDREISADFSYRAQYRKAWNLWKPAYSHARNS